LTHDLIHFKARLNNGYSRNKCQGVGRHFLFLPTVHTILNDYVLYFFRQIFSKATTTHHILLEVPSTHPIPPTNIPGRAVKVL
jgi:hypothetical protein